jgi:hypothetical protein
MKEQPDFEAGIADGQMPMGKLLAEDAQFLFFIG